MAMNDQIVRALSSAGGIRVLTCSAGKLARKICSLQQPSATASIALGRGLSGGALMGALLKTGQRIALKFEGNGPLRTMIVEADSDGAVRGCLGNPSADAEPVNGMWNVAAILGRAGFLTVSKDLGMGGEPYRGMVQLHTSEIGDDLAFYLADSEQVPSAVGLGAAIDTSGHISVCGGFLVQALPKAEESEIDQIMANIANLPPITSLIQEVGPAGVMKSIFGDVPYTLLETHDIFFRCGCSHEKVERALLSFDQNEIRDMIDKDDGAKVSCEFCRQVYQFDAAELAALTGMDVVTEPDCRS